MLVGAMMIHLSSVTLGRLTMKCPHRIIGRKTILLQVFTHFRLCPLFPIAASETGAPSFPLAICKCGLHKPLGFCEPFSAPFVLTSVTGIHPRTITHLDFQSYWTHNNYIYNSPCIYSSVDLLCQFYYVHATYTLLGNDRS